MRKFSIYYNNGDVVHGGGEDDEEVTLTFSRKWLEAPSDGVAVVVSEAESTGRSQQNAYEYYYQLPINGHGNGVTGGSMKVGAFLRQVGIVKFGGWTEDVNHNALMIKASHDEWVGKQSANKRPIAEDEAD